MTEQLNTHILNTNVIPPHSIPTACVQVGAPIMPFFFFANEQTKAQRDYVMGPVSKWQG